MAARWNFTNLYSILESFHAYDALWGVEFVDFLGFAILKVGYQLAVSINQRVVKDTSHGFTILATVLAIGVLALASTHLRDYSVSIGCFCVNIASVSFSKFFQALAVDTLVSVLTAQSEHYSAAGHTKAAKQNHHEKQGQLLKSTGFFFRKDLLELDLESLILACLFEIS